MNRYETGGEIVESSNLDLSKKLGKLIASPKLLKVFDTTDLAGSPKTVEAFGTLENYIYTLGHNVYRCNLSADITDFANWAKVDALDSLSASALSDAEFFSGAMRISTGTDIASWDGTTYDDNWWTSAVSGTALTNNYPHTLHVHRGGQETFFVTDKNLVRYYNATAGHSAVTLQADLVSCSVTSGVSAVWVGTYNTNIANAYVYEIYVGEQISGAPVARNAYEIDGRAVLSCVTIGGVPYIITDRGSLQYFNGAGFETIATLPFFGTDITLEGIEPDVISALSRPVHPKGMRAKDRSILINVSTKTTNATYPDHSPSGIWEFDIDTRQLTHHLSFADEASHAGTSILDHAGPIILVNSPNTSILAIGEPDETQVRGVYGLSTSTPQSHFVTIELESDSVQDAYESVYQMAKTLAVGERIDLKYRTTKRDPIFAECSYSNSNEISTTASVSNVQVGDEVTDTYTGLIAHVTAKTSSPTVTTFTLDTDIGTANATRMFVFQNYNKIATTYTSADGEWKRDGDFGVNPWCQFKAVLYGAVEYRRFLVKTNSKSQT